MGDFNTRVGNMAGLEGNTPDTNNNYPMFMNFIAEVNMTIIRDSASLTPTISNIHRVHYLMIQIYCYFSLSS